MFIKHEIKVIFFVIFLLFTGISKGFTCGLALHDWHLKLFFKIPLNAPFVPLSEIDAVQKHFDKAVTDRILWVIKPGILSPYNDFFISFVEGWASKVKWEIVTNNKSVIKLSKRFEKDEKKPLIIGSDKNYLKIAVFADANSNNNCWQFVFAQDSRIRCIFQDSQNPWAQEFNMQSWFSVIFFRVPVPGNIMALSIYPIDGVKNTFFEDQHLVEHLIGSKCLKQRPDLVVDPYSFDFPDLPE